MPPVASPLRPSPEDKRRTLTGHFLQVLEPILKSGTRYADLSVEQIITAGGIARSTFYDYFDDKGALLSAMADDVLADLLGRGISWWSISDAATKAELRLALLPAIETHQRHATILRAVAEAASYDPRMQQRRARLLGDVIVDLTKHIGRAQRAGSACRELDPERTAKWLICMLDGGLYELFTTDEADEAEKLVDAVTDVIWRTLYDGYRDA